jgi:hypothetical protein
MKDYNSNFEDEKWEDIKGNIQTGLAGIVILLATIFLIKACRADNSKIIYTGEDEDDDTEIPYHGPGRY